MTTKATPYRFSTVIKGRCEHCGQKIEATYDIGKHKVYPWHHISSGDVECGS